MKKKILFIVFAVFMFMPYIVYGKSVVVGGTTVDGSNVAGVTFNSGTDTLTLNNFVGEKIEFKDFDENTNITINIKGTNIITGPGYTENNNAIYANSDVNFIFNGEENSSLKITKAYNAIYIGRGNITFNKVNLLFDDISYCASYIYYKGNITVIDSKIKTSDTVYGLNTNGGNISVKNSKLDFDKASYILYAAAGSLNIDNTEITAKDCVNYGIITDNESKDASIFKDSKIKIDGAQYGVYAYDGYKFINSTLDFNNVDYGFYIRDYYENDISVIFENSTVKLNDFDEGFWFKNADVIMNNSKLNLKSERDNSYGIYNENKKVIFNNSEADIDVTGPAIIIYSEEEPENLVEINGDSYLEDSTIGSRVYKDGEDYYLVLGKYIDPSEVNDYNKIEDASSNKVVILLKKAEENVIPEEKTENPETVDNISKYILTLLISSIIMGINIVSIKSKEKEN